MPKRTFSKSVLDSIHKTKILGIRSGRDHRFTGIWVIVVRNRVFVRSWSNQKTGWYAAFLENPVGMIQIGERQIPIRGKKTRGEKLIDSIDLAYAEKYNTAASLKYVRGFAKPKRRATTLEIIPR